MSLEEYNEILHKYYGYETLKKEQYEIINNKTGNRYKQELVGESAYYDIRRLANDFVSNEIVKELRALGKK